MPFLSCYVDQHRHYYYSYYDHCNPGSSGGGTAAESLLLLLIIITTIFLLLLLISTIIIIVISIIIVITITLSAVSISNSVSIVTIVCCFYYRLRYQRSGVLQTTTEFLSCYGKTQELCWDMCRAHLVCRFSSAHFLRFCQLLCFFGLLSRSSCF